ncbi:MAG: hypothetical protein ACLP7O_10605 [Terracidiphilus sp.]
MIMPPEPVARIRTSFSITVHAPYAAAAPLFGPLGESVWAGVDWNPQFIYPQPPRDVEDAVFTVQDGPLNKIWVNTLFDLDARHIQYVYFLTELLVTTIDVRFKPMDAGTTHVNVVYTRTALTPQGNEQVSRMSEGDKKAGAEWQEAIDSYLASVKTGHRH